MKNIIALIDFSEMTNSVVEKAAEVAERFSSTLWLLHVADPEFDGFEAGPQLGCGSRPPKDRRGTEIMENWCEITMQEKLKLNNKDTNRFLRDWKEWPALYSLFQGILGAEIKNEQ